MRAALRITSYLALGLSAVPAWAVDSTLTAAGFSGLGVTPNAALLQWGEMGTIYENQVAGNPRRLEGHNLSLGFGLLPNLEVAGRLATNTIHNNCFTGCGARDLSASGKLAIGLDASKRWHVAVGTTDIGGSVTFFRTYYGVLTYDVGPFQASGGLAKRSGAGILGSRSPLNGPFASAAWQPFPLVRGHLEYSDGKAWAGVRLYAPAGWIPEGWALSAGINASLNNSPLTKRASWNAGVTIPLYKTPAMPGTAKAPLPVLPSGQLREPSYEARTPSATQAAPSTNSRAVRPADAHPAPEVAAPAPQIAVADDRIHALADALQAKGLEDIWVGRMPDGMVAVRVNNGSYQWNSVDALGVALGAVARTLGDGPTGYRLILTVRQLPLVAVTGQANCLKEWISTTSNSCTAGQLSTPGSAPLRDLHDGVTWIVQRQMPGWQTVRVNISPVLRTNLGTEFGAYDYALGANVKAQLPLWAGASVDYAVDVPIAHSDDFARDRIFGLRRVRSGTDRLAFTQTMRLPVERWLSAGAGARWSPGAVTAQVTAGRIGRYYDGAIADLRWEPGEGHHRFSAQAGAFRNNEYLGGLGPLGQVKRAFPILGSYRYSVMATRTDLEATAGQFMNNDRGVQIGMRQWFADTAVGVYYKRSVTGSNPARQLVGIELSIPIGPRRDWQPLPHVQVGGAPRFEHAVETTVGTAGGNTLRLGRAVRPPTPDLDAVFNSDRSSLAYFEDNLRRIRDAAR